MATALLDARLYVSSELSRRTPNWRVPKFGSKAPISLELLGAVVAVCDVHLYRMAIIRLQLVIEICREKRAIALHTVGAGSTVW